MVRLRGLVRGQFIATRPVPVSGFQWENNVIVQFPDLRAPFVHTEGPYLVPLGDEMKQALPLKEKDLHHHFAELKTDDDILSFANSWGLLGHGIISWVPGLDENNKPIHSSNVPVESAWYWRSEIRKMYSLLDIWQLVSEAQKEDKFSQMELSKHVRWWKNGSVTIQWPEEFPPMSRHQPGMFIDLLAWPGDEATQELLVRWKRGNVVEPARYYVHKAINRRLGGKGDSGDELGGRPHVLPHVLPYMEGDILMYADCLLAALYCLFALEVAGKTPPARSCKVCGEIFQPKKRNDAITCSPRCRQWLRRHPGVGNHE